ncbi:MAG: helix-hairpin-helix domain-containing protein [Dehalococcoidales bacterium]|nr:helix-hairpin-helix domain-containing protein [Dehalococcoidales bacterium]
MKKSISILLSISVFACILSAGCSRSELIEISFDAKPRPSLMGQVFIDGEVRVAGIYPLKEDDTLQSLLESAGGLKKEEDRIFCWVYFSSEWLFEDEQKVDLNRANEWLLQALPGIGEGTAKNIVSYRKDHGPFRHVKELMNVDGIGEATFDRLADKITVLDMRGPAG